MTEDFSLPPELRELEERLAASPRGIPRGALRERFLSSVPRELRGAERRARWTFTVAVAATALVWLNRSMSATQATDCGLHFDGGQASVEQAAEEIRRLLPELPPQEALRQAILLRASTGLVPCPSISPKCDLPSRNRGLTEIVH